MRIKKIHIKDFISYKDTELNLINNVEEDPTLFLIDGINLDTDDDNSSNGTGKSSLISSSLVYNIYGKNLRDKKLNDLIRHSTDKLSNEVEYFVKDENNNDNILNISRTKTLKSSTTNIFLNNKDLSKRTKDLSDKDIINFMDLNVDSFCQSVCYYTDNDNLFKLSYSQRLDYFKKLIDLSIIDKYYEKIKKFKSNNELKLFEINTIIKNTKDIINIVEENKDDYIKFLNKSIEEIDKKIDKENEIVIPSNDKYNNMLSELNEILKEKSNEFDENKKIVLSINSDTTKIEKEIHRFGILSGVHCPTCNQLITGDYVNSVVEEYKNQLKELDKKQKEYSTILKEIDDVIKEIKKNIDIVKDKINDNNTKLRLKESNIRLLNNEKIKLKNELNKSIKENNKEKIDKNKYEIKLLGFQNALSIRDEWNKSLEYWYNILSPKSILRSSLLRKYIGVLSDLFSYYLSKLFEDEIIATISIDDTGNIDTNIIHNGFEINYFSMSSGEKKRIDVSMQLAMFKFIKSINTNAPEFMVWDEPLDSLDHSGIENVIKLLNEFMLENKLDIYIISHIPIPTEILHNINIKNILVNKKDNISSAKIITPII